MRLGTGLLLILAMPALCSARTWRVEQDGSGDFTNIQPAVDASSPRDTVLVGPGRYDQFWVFDPVLHFEVIVGVHVDSLTIIGTDRESVIIGPTELYPKTQSDKDALVVQSIGIVFGLENTWGVVENVTVENVRRGIDLYPSGSVADCTFRDILDDGVLADKAIKASITGCEAYNCTGRGVRVFAYGGGQIHVDVSDCRVEGSQTGYYFSHPNVSVTNCIAIGCNTGYGVVGGSVTMSQIEADSCFGGLEVDGGDLTLADSRFHNSGYRDIASVGGGYLHGSNLVLEGGGVGETIFIANGLYDLHHSDIGRSNGYSARVLYHIRPRQRREPDGQLLGNVISRFYRSLDLGRQ